MVKISTKNEKFPVVKIYNILKQSLPYKTSIYQSHVVVYKRWYFSSIKITPNLSYDEMKIEANFPIWFMILAALFVPLLGVLIYLFVFGRYIYPPFEKEVTSVILSNQSHSDYYLTI